MKKLLLVIGFIVLFAAEMLRVYLIMPFPGSQQSNTIGLAYFIDQNIFYIRFAILLIIAIPLISIFLRSKIVGKIFLSLVLALYVFIFCMVNFKLRADKMFYQPENKNLVPVGENKVAKDKLVVGVEINGEAKAYPIEIIGYHHQVQDTLAGESIMVTYCTVCRTGRVYSPFINGKKQTFRLVGMDHFNAMFEDNTTKSWWQQATGIAVTGELKGSALKEIPSQQMTLAAWLRAYPQSKILQADPVFKAKYDSLAGFDKGTLESSLEKRDSGSWKMKSWVVGVAVPGASKAYDWNDLVKKQVIEDSLPNMPVTVYLENDSTSFHVWNRTLSGQSLHFIKDSAGLKDINTQSVWNEDGICIKGVLQGNRLKTIQASQEFWHAWENFHPGTVKYIAN